MKRFNQSITGMASTCVFVLFLLQGVCGAGNLEPPGPPSAGSGMISLEELNNYLLKGTTPAAPGSFEEPVAAPPTSGTMVSIQQIYDAVKALMDQGTAGNSDVLSGKKYFSTSPWGIQTGTMQNVGRQYICPMTTNVSITKGYHDGSGHVDGDPDLISGNIRSGVTIFGVTGNRNVVDTYSGNATSATVSFGKKAWVDGVEITGNLAGGTPCNPDATYSTQKRWCDNGDGTITDTTTGLIWYKKCDLFGIINECGDPSSPLYPTLIPNWISNMHHESPSDLQDGSRKYDWRLPTMKEMQDIISGTEAISCDSSYFFEEVKNGYYWTCTGSSGSSSYFLQVLIENNSDLTVEHKPLYTEGYAMAVRNPYP